MYDYTATLQAEIWHIAISLRKDKKKSVYWKKEKQKKCVITEKVGTVLHVIGQNSSLLQQAHVIFYLFCSHVSIQSFTMAPLNLKLTQKETKEGEEDLNIFNVCFM